MEYGDNVLFIIMHMHCAAAMNARGCGDNVRATNDSAKCIT